MEKFVRKSLAVYLSIILIATVIRGYINYKNHNPWSIGDWLINYRGGFYRRGLLGELILYVSSLVGMNPGLIVFILQSLFYASFYFATFMLLRNQRRIMNYCLLIFSPFIFLFQLYAGNGGFRKEIIYFSVLSCVVYFASSCKEKPFERIFYVALFLYPLMILTHEMLAVFLPYFFIVYFYVVCLTTRRIVTMSILLIPSIVCFIVVSSHAHGTIDMTEAMLSAVSDQNYELSRGIFESIPKPISDGRKMVINSIVELNYIKVYLQAILLACLAYIPVRKNIAEILKSKLSSLMFIISILGSIPLFVNAIDWGRIIYIHCVSIFLLSLLVRKETFDGQAGFLCIEANGRKAVNYACEMLIVFMSFVYCLTWHIPYCCQASLPFGKHNVQHLIGLLRHLENLHQLL